MAGAGRLPGAGAVGVTDIQLTVLGVAAPQGSKRHVGHGRMVESSKRVGPWREAIVTEAQRQGVAGLMLDEPLLVTIIVTLPRPAGHYGTGRNRAQVKASAPAYPAGKPDVDKLARSCMDGLVQAGVIVDDARVVSLHARKVWALPGAASATRISVHGVAS